MAFNLCLFYLLRFYLDWLGFPIDACPIVSIVSIITGTKINQPGLLINLLPSKHLTVNRATLLPSNLTISIGAITDLNLLRVIGQVSSRAQSTLVVILIRALPCDIGIQTNQQAAEGQVLNCEFESIFSHDSQFKTCPLNFDCIFYTANRDDF